MEKNVEEKHELEVMMPTPKESPGSKTVDENRAETESILISPDEEVDHDRISDTSNNTSSQPCPSSSTMVKPKDNPGSKTVNEKRAETESILIFPDEEVDQDRINDSSDNTSSQPCPSSLTPTLIEGILFLHLFIKQE